MKNAIIVISVVALFSSCKKDWDCTCKTDTTTNIDGFVTSFSVTGTETLENLKEDAAESECASRNLSVSTFGTSSVTTCSLN